MSSLVFAIRTHLRSLITSCITSSRCKVITIPYNNTTMANPELMTGLGAACSIFLCSAGSAIASIQAGIYALEQKDGSGIYSFFPIMSAGILSIYGIIIAVILSRQSEISQEDGFKNFCAGLSVGLASLVCVVMCCINRGIHVRSNIICLSLWFVLIQACLMSGIGMSKFLEKHMAPRYHSRSTITRCSDQQEPLLLSGDTHPSSHATFVVPPASQRLLTLMVFFEAIGLYGLIVALILSCHKK